MFGEILSYIYSGTLHVSMDTVQPLYQAADHLQLDYVRDTCSNYMAMNVERSTCVDLYKFADVFYVENVQKQCLQWIARHFTEVASSEEFCSLSVNQLTEIISYDELDVKEEATVWEAVVRWVQHSREDRLHHLPSILPHIRFNLLTSDDRAAILENPLVKENPGSSEVMKNVVQKVNSNLKPRLGMTTEMILLCHGSKEILFMNPREEKNISCTYKPEDLPDFLAMTVTSDNDIYMLEAKELENEDQVSLFKYNHAKNAWEHECVSSISKRPEGCLIHREQMLFEVDGTLFYIVFYEDGPFLLMRKYNQHTKQWQECSQLRFDPTVYYSVTLSCGSHIYFLTSDEVHRYDLTRDKWIMRTPPFIILDVCTAVTMRTEIFFTNFDFSWIMVYDTESDRWQKLQSWSNPGNLEITECPSLFVLDNQLHIWLICENDDDEEEHLLYVYDRSADAWTDLKATLPDKKYYAYGHHCQVARMYLPYLK
ncbi:kelch repeat and BTB domain-containing protein 8-like [Branchiostoma floridae]|uniref:Kelch repeat and BTB domain-containing protein 8-like n=1 Tax=Branchiostoma floridae TaxID=7739 RepID=A0A9J7K7I5_BRAFL|nr:kelch repeat and BTB domain-containing protein 8-like [Branchiostoma floridae]